jgi:serine/threonine protein phosphatase PrpC
MSKVTQKIVDSYSSSYTESSSYDSSSFSSEGSDLLGNLGTLGLDLINPLLSSYSISGGKTTEGDSSSYESSFSTTEESSESSVEVVKKVVEPVKPVKALQQPAKTANIVMKKGQFVMPDHEPTDEELAELEAKLKANSKGNRHLNKMGLNAPTANATAPSKPEATKPVATTPPSTIHKTDSKPLPTRPQVQREASKGTSSTPEHSDSNSKPSNSWTKSDNKKGNSEKNSLDKKGSAAKSFLSPRDKKSVFTDVEGDTFSLFRRMNEIRDEKKQESAGKKDTKEPTEEPTLPAENQGPLEYGDGTEPLIRDFSVKEDMNKEGMKKAKKFSVVQGKGQPKFQMEDKNFCAFPHAKNKNIGIFCVFDGHAGKNCAEKLTKIFPETFYKKFQNGKWEEKTDLTPLFKEVYQEVDDNLKEFLYEGSTATTVIIWRNPKTNKKYIQCANLGDSTCFMIRNGRSVIISEDHKLSVASERQRIVNMGVQLTQDQTRLCGLAVARAFGDIFPKSEKCGITAEPFISLSIELSKTDTTVILASDGLWDIVPDGQKAYEIIKNIKNPADAAKQLLKTAVPQKNNVCSDNVTVCVISLV